jgi:hypothetical protein
MALMNSLGTAYTGQAGQRAPTLTQLNQARLALLPFARMVMQGQNIDVSQLPRFNLFSRDLLDASNAAPEPGAEQGLTPDTGSEVDDSTFDQYAPRPQ